MGKRNELYDDLAAQLSEHEGPLHNTDLVNLAGIDACDDRLVSVEAGRLRGALNRRLREHPDFKARGGFENKHGQGSRDGNFRILRGDDYVRNQILHNLKRVQEVMLEVQYDNLKLMEDMGPGADKKTAGLLTFAKENAQSLATALVGQMDDGIRRLSRRHPEFKQLRGLQDQLDEFYALAFAPEESE